MTPHPPTAILLSPSLPVVRAARGVGARSIVLAPGYPTPDNRQAAAEADEAIEVDWTDHPRLLHAIGRHADAPGRVSVFGFAETSALIAARANEALRLPGNPHAAVAYLTDKAALRGRVNTLAGAPVRFEHCDLASTLVPVAERVGFPCVAKPRTGFGGQDVHTLHAPADAAALAAQLPPEPALIVEEYLTGPEISVQAHSHRGEHTILGVVRSHSTGVPPHRVVTGYDLPADLDPSTLSQVYELVMGTLDTAGQHNGPSQTELVLTSLGPRLIESQAHPGDGHISELLAATGTDIVGLTIAAALGLPAPSPAHDPRATCAGVRFLHLPPGQLQRLHGLEEARALPGVTDVKITVPPGSHAPETTSRVSGHGLIAAVADGPQELDALLRKALDSLRPVVVGAASQPDSPHPGGHTPAPAATVKEEEPTAV